MKKVEILSEFRIVNPCEDNLVTTASKVGDGIVNFADSFTEMVVQRRIQWEEKCLIESCSDRLLLEGIEVFMEEMQRRKLKGNNIMTSKQKNIKVYVENDVGERINLYGLCSTKETQEKLNRIEPLAIIDEGDYESLFDGYFEINGNYYSACMSSQDEDNIYLITEQIQIDNEGEETTEDSLTCPICGYEDLDCWEYSKDYDENWKCPHCGSTIAWEREHAVSYTARVKELRKPRTVKLIDTVKQLYGNEAKND